QSMPSSFRGIGLCFESAADRSIKSRTNINRSAPVIRISAVRCSALLLLISNISAFAFSIPKDNKETRQLVSLYPSASRCPYRDLHLPLEPAPPKDPKRLRHVLKPIRAIDHRRHLPRLKQPTHIIQILIRLQRDNANLLSRKQRY